MPANSNTILISHASFRAFSTQTLTMRFVKEIFESSFKEEHLKLIDYDDDTDVSDLLFPYGVELPLGPEAQHTLKGLDELGRSLKNFDAPKFGYGLVDVKLKVLKNKIIVYRIGQIISNDVYGETILDEEEEYQEDSNE